MRPGFVLTVVAPGRASWRSPIGKSLLSGAPGITDHGELSGLSDDDHAQYLLLAGRAGENVIVATDAKTLNVSRVAGGSGNPSLRVLGTYPAVNIAYGLNVQAPYGEGSSPTATITGGLATTFVNLLLRRGRTSGGTEQTADMLHCRGSAGSGDALLLSVDRYGDLIARGTGTSGVAPVEIRSKDNGATDGTLVLRPFATSTRTGIRFNRTDDADGKGFAAIEAHGIYSTQTVAHVSLYTSTASTVASCQASGATTTITAPSGLSAVVVGGEVSGHANIQAATTVAAIVSDTQITLSQATTGAIPATTLTFGGGDYIKRLDIGADAALADVTWNNIGTMKMNSGSFEIVGSAEAITLPSNGTLRFRPNAGGSPLSALSKDTSDNVGLGGENIPNVYLQCGPLGTRVLRATTDGGNRVRIGDAVAPTETLDVNGTCKAVTFSGSGASLASIPETAITDGALLARLASAETITGTWTFPGDGTNAPVFQVDVGAAQLVWGVLFDTATAASVSLSVSGALSAGSALAFPGAGGIVVTAAATQNISAKTFTGNNTINAHSANVIKCNTSGPVWQDNTDTTKRCRFNASEISTSSTRDLYFHDYSGKVVTVGRTTAAIGVLGISDLTAQTTSITAQTLLSASAASVGMFRVSFWLKTTTAGTAGDVVKVTVAFNDGTAQTADVLLTNMVATPTAPAINHDLATNTRASYGSVTGYVSGSTTVTYTTTVTKTGTPQYTIRARIEALG